jgi:hypothetical protein
MYSLQVMSGKGHDVYEYDKDNIDEIAEMVLDKIEHGWILYGKENETDREMKIVIDSREVSTEQSVKTKMDKLKYAMMDNAESNEEPLRFKKKVLAPIQRGG